MDVREKLVEQAISHFWYGVSHDIFSEPVTTYAKLAIEALEKEKESGVTVQEWVSTKDRLPEIPEGCAESPEPVLYMMKNTKNIYAGYYGEGGVWKDKYFRQYADSKNGVDADDVLCWMYQHDLPHPPKGE